eukprot:2624681-Pyramimonas_sp.AAC.1
MATAHADAQEAIQQYPEDQGDGGRDAALLRIPKNRASTVATQRGQGAIARRTDEHRQQKEAQGDLAPLRPPHAPIFGALLGATAEAPAVG